MYIIHSDENVIRLRDEAKDLENHLWMRQLPVDDEEYKQKVLKVESKLSKKGL